MFMLFLGGLTKFKQGTLYTFGTIGESAKETVWQ